MSESRLCELARDEDRMNTLQEWLAERTTELLQSVGVLMPLVDAVMYSDTTATDDVMMEQSLRSVFFALGQLQGIVAAAALAIADHAVGSLVQALRQWLIAVFYRKLEEDADDSDDSGYDYLELRSFWFQPDVLEIVRRAMVLLMRTISELQQATQPPKKCLTSICEQIGAAWAQPQSPVQQQLRMLLVAVDTYLWDAQPKRVLSGIADLLLQVEQSSWLAVLTQDVDIQQYFDAIDDGWRTVLPGLYSGKPDIVPDSLGGGYSLLSNVAYMHNMVSFAARSMAYPDSPAAASTYSSYTYHFSQIVWYQSSTDVTSLLERALPEALAALSKPAINASKWRFMDIVDATHRLVDAIRKEKFLEA
jgi:hypothetical protein